VAQWDKYEYRPGLRFQSRYAAMQVHIRSRKDIYALDGTKVDEVPALIAEFGVLGPEYKYTNLSGEEDTAAVINGHFFDLDQYAEENDLSQDEKELCAKRLLYWADTYPSEGWLYEPLPVPAPWPNYDQTHHNQIPVTAETVGLVAEALNYETQNKNRDSVVEKLKEALARAQAGPATDEEEVLVAE
jgi:hypothetical protein